MNTSSLLTLLSSHIGSANGITVKALAQHLDCPERAVRYLVTELRDEGVAVCGRPNTGFSSPPMRRSWRKPASSSDRAPCTACTWKRSSEKPRCPI